MIKIWDQWIRLFHWSLVFAVGFSLISGETGVGFFEWHRFAGEFVLGLILFRLIWGLVGSSNARLLSLVVHPRHAVQHLRELLGRDMPQERGHNAAGGWAVLAMLLLISVQAITGLFIADEEGWVEGAFYGVLSSDLRDFLYNVHHTNADLLQAIVLVHIAMIAIYFFFGKQNLLTPMITGVMKWHSEAPAPEVRFASFIAGLVVAVLVFGLVALTLGWVPI